MSGQEQQLTVALGTFFSFPFTVVVADWSPASRCLVCLLSVFAGFYIIYAFMCHVSCIFFFSLLLPGEFHWKVR